MILFDLATLTTLLRKGPAPMMGGGARAGGPLVYDYDYTGSREDGYQTRVCIARLAGGARKRGTS